ncbi:MAG: hypothetical protein JWR02_1364 [Mucilaginibacter sp.]|jgi:hypothetical protein|nr:hypothetical protein [Mucilaginibacter sp.]MDB5131615.1 hypothetical protein [Mucilaginibacter sp.]
MWKKGLLNVLYNICIFLCFIAAYQYGIIQKQYAYIFGAVVFIVIFIILKIRLLKEIKNAQKKP